jgi:nitroimidazol reductase NimA-like FMN-containing flavoprotein (pyridoxamine 5'-phosphate oxidase superfamily)
MLCVNFHFLQQPEILTITKILKLLTAIEIGIWIALVDGGRRFMKRKIRRNRQMVEIEEMSGTQMHEFLRQMNYGHLGCSREGHSYVVPIHYVHHKDDFYFFTTEGMKTEYISANPNVCLQVEEVQDSSNWRSVIVTGIAELLTEQEDADLALQYIKESNPTLTPALNKMWVDAWGRASKVAIYRIQPGVISGRKTLPQGESRGPVVIQKQD